MKHNEIEEFFSCVGEIRRDITTIEFLMRSCIAKYDGEIEKFPQPPYFKGKTYNDMPQSFTKNRLFGQVVEEFNKKFPEIDVPQELVELRNGMAHGLISQINDNPVNQLIKFDKSGTKIDFCLDLKIQTLQQLRQSIKEYRVYISKKL